MNRIGYHGQGGEYTIFTRNTAVAQQRLALQPLIQRKSVRPVARRGGNPPRELGRLSGPTLKVGGPRIALYVNAAFGKSVHAKPKPPCVLVNPVGPTLFPLALSYPDSFSGRRNLRFFL